jgi:hypothetical protein
MITYFPYPYFPDTQTGKERQDDMPRGLEPVVRAVNG